MIVGITGGIGSGKSTVCKIFEGLGIPVFKADEVARTISDRNNSVIAKIKETFGPEMYEGNKLIRPKMAALVFNNPDALAKLNAIVHPAVRLEFAEWKDRNSNKPYLLYEAAILFESGSALFTGKKIIVTAPLELRIQRVMQRDNASKAEVENRIKNQWPEEKKIALSDYVIVNDDITPVLPQVLAIDKILKAL